MATIELKVPDIGDFKDVDIAEVLVKPGDSIVLEQSLITIETDKASMEIPASHAGVVKELRVKVGDKVSMGSILALVELAEEAPKVASAPAPAPAPAVTPARPVAVAAAPVAATVPTAAPVSVPAYAIRPRFAPPIWA